MRWRLTWRQANGSPGEQSNMGVSGSPFSTCPSQTVLSTLIDPDKGQPNRVRTASHSFRFWVQTKLPEVRTPPADITPSSCFNYCEQKPDEHEWNLLPCSRLKLSSTFLSETEDASSPGQPFPLLAASHSYKEGENPIAQQAWLTQLFESVLQVIPVLLQGWKLWV